MISPTPVQPGDRVAVLSPAWAAPAYFSEVHEQALERIRTELGLEPVEYPTTRKMGATPAERAADINAAFADPSIRAILSTVGGDDQIQVVPLLDPALPVADPKPFFGYSDNTNILNWLWGLGVGAYHGGSTMVHLTGPHIDAAHIHTLRAALFGEGDVVIPASQTSQDYGWDWSDPRALTEPSPRGPALPIEFFGKEEPVRGRTWGGCLEVLDQLAFAGRLPAASELEGAILIFETSEQIPPADFVGRWVRAMGERGYLDAAAGLAFARPVVADRDHPEVPESELAAKRMAYYEYLLANISRYREDLTVCLDLPFGHTRPQVVLPYGGEITLDPANRAVIGHYGS
ncbi:muramoyltetrapeptide carboxypeptidase LdcA involved in peptidoglycan recycling [Arcanobacterium wilhelmae]|uniref:Muramoyltetrapeptide carboxypeptidase LdcA involved in peptidoglycan recycling n=1 Tax=Arcanobacterium wilhelmae TaxID=1803177 RepID=A0ABT9NDL2_9ACTO|nr:S66 peptidase family protein [Arcanobacterium wilhelmae]MDP9801291.1 muramoyltetrapeptide carboxypeptidase LdcA involved in peptidoglycan recycling [Arcanobacterium wilhelmae]